MKTLREVFNSVRDSMHWGPAMEPFHLAVIEKCEALEARIAMLESERTDDKAMMDMFRSEWNEMFPKRSPSDAKYIISASAVQSQAQAIVDAMSGPVADDAASITEDAPAAPEQNPAEPVQKPVPDLLEASPEPVPAGPDASNMPDDHPVDSDPVDPVDPVVDTASAA